MKSTLLALLTLLVLSSKWLYAAETEPNDSRNQANKLNLNSSNTGAIGVAGDVDWWKVTTTSDGKLDITLTVSNSLYCYYDLYDNDGTTLLFTDNTNGTETHSIDGLASGTYYINLHSFFAGQLPAYTISNLLTVAPVANDVEPNGLYTQAKVLAVSGSVTGHCGYYYNLVRDTTDWWSITTTGNGMLSITMTSQNAQYIYWQLYDNNGTTLLKSENTNGTKTSDVDGLAAGTYYLKVYAYFSTGFIPYTLTSLFTAPPVSNDVEPNGIYTQAKVLPLDGSATGQVGYYYNLAKDTTDWWSITTTGNGMLSITMASQNAQYLYWQLYDHNGTTLLKSDNTNGTKVYNVDGLAAGTYYVKVYPYYSTGFIPYILSTVFTAPPVANDSEPNDSKSQAKVLPLNNKKTGQVGYYYDGARDLSDWFKFTTTSDGLVKLTLKSENGQYLYWQLFDKDGTTSLFNDNTNGNKSYSVDGLAVGTYYVKVYPYYSDGFASYTLADTLYPAPVANDPEPNDGKSQALDFATGSTVTGHSGYYYDLQRDAEDWYKIVTTRDGQIDLTITSGNGQYVYCQLYDNDATTLLKSDYTNGTTTHHTDGLAAGTYYVKVFPYYGTGFIPYTLSNTLSEYANANDGLNNDVPAKAATLGANNATPGHTGFRFNGGAQDPHDWWKINYTGNSDLTVALNWEPRICCGLQYVYLRVYADTAASPIYNQYSNSGSLTANFTGLAKQYYYVQVINYYGSEWAAYNLTPTFNQKDKAKITLQSSTVGTDCANGSLVYKCTKSSKPYTVQLFRFGKKYGSAISVKNTSAFTIGSLPPGNYYATAYGDGATGSAKGTSETTTIVPVPTGLSTSKIKTNKAQLNWDTLACVDFDSVYYRVQGSGTWTKKETGNNNSAYSITGLTPSTTYEWMVAHVVSESGETATSSYSGIVTFTTKALKLGEEEMSATGDLGIYPNPASQTTTLHFSANTGGEIALKLFDAVGHSIDAWTLQSEDGEYVYEMNLSTLAAGIYYVRVVGGGSDQTVKIVKQ